MKLNDIGLKDRQAWEAKGYALPAYDRETVRKATRENPFWIHFGGGNIFRAFQANVVQNLLNEGVLDRGLTVAEGWVKNGVAEPGFEAYVKGSKVSFPWSMIDKITPRPNASVEKIIGEDGIEGLEPVITSMKSYVAPFVNAEETEYLVIEDDFPNGRPALEKGGIMFTDRETVDKVEKMKVCTCLNPLHTALAVYGCLLGYDLISKEMEDEDLVSLVRTIGYKEGLPVVVNPGILDPREFIDTVLQVRIPNPFMPDTPQRIATDTSQKLAIRFGETIKAYQKAADLDVQDLKLIPLVQAGLAPRVIQYFNELITGPGAVRRTFAKYVH